MFITCFFSLKRYFPSFPFSNRSPIFIKRSNTQTFVQNLKIKKKNKFDTMSV